MGITGSVLGVVAGAAGLVSVFLASTLIVVCAAWLAVLLMRKPVEAQVVAMQQEYKKPLSSPKE